MTVGNETAGRDYQVHVCSSQKVSQISDKQGLSLIEEWKELDQLVVPMNEFIDKILKGSTDPPGRLLAKHWLWEYW